MPCTIVIGDGDLIGCRVVGPIVIGDGDLIGCHAPL